MRRNYYKILMTTICSLFILGVITPTVKAELRSTTTFAFDATITAQFAKFFKQPSAIAGKTNAQVMGINTDAPGFDWSNINTWVNADGKAYEASGANAITFWGAQFSGTSGKVTHFAWSDIFEPNYLPNNTANVVNLAGKLELSSSELSVFHCSGTQIDTLILSAAPTGSSYFHAKRNPKLKYADISGVGVFVRQIHMFKNPMLNKILVGDWSGTKFDWASEFEECAFKFSTLPMKANGGTPSKYTPQAAIAVGTIENGVYSVKPNAEIDLSSEATVAGVSTVYTWKEGETEVTPTTSNGGKFTFDASFAGKTLKCFMKNTKFSALTLETVSLLIKEEGSTEVEPIVIGTLKNGIYTYIAGQTIDLSTLAASDGENTVFTWKDANGAVITPASTPAPGKFTFDKIMTGRFIKCEMTNSKFSTPKLETVSVKVYNSFVWNFPTEQTAQWKAFFQQSSAEAGKTNAEVIGMAITRPGFDWDDMNTWCKADGTLWNAGGGASYAVVFWGAGMKPQAPYNGGISWLCWTARDANWPVAGEKEDRWNAAPAGFDKLSGTLVLTTGAVTVHCSDTKIKSLTLNSVGTDASYYHIRRNSMLTNADLTGAGVNVKELYAFNNAIETLKFGDWSGTKFGIAQIYGNKLKFSTLPLTADGTSKGVYTPQQAVVIGTLKNNVYTYIAGQTIDLSSEAVVDGVNTVYKWVDAKTGEEVTPTSIPVAGKFTFDKIFTGRSLKCQMTNTKFPALTLETVPVKVYQNSVWAFDPVQVEQLAKFLKQPSVEAGKTNADAIGIATTRSGFDWTDMNTWADATGQVWKNGAATSGFAELLWGPAANTGAIWGGGISNLRFSTESAASSPAGYQNLKGKFEFTFAAPVIHFSDTKIDSIKFTYTYTGSQANYLHIKRNANLKYLDISACTSQTKQINAQDNNLEEIILGDWTGNRLNESVNLSNNRLKFSTLPYRDVLPATYIYTPQKAVVIGTLEGSTYVIGTGDEIDLSSEAVVAGTNTVYTWKDGENIVTPATAVAGKFTFDDSAAGKTLVCTMTNAKFPALTLSTVPVLIKTLSGNDANASDKGFSIYPNPVSDVLNITGENNGVNVYDLTGNLVMSIISSVNSVSLSELANGIYVVKVSTPNGIKVQQIVKE